MILPVVELNRFWLFVFGITITASVFGIGNAYAVDRYSCPGCTQIPLHEIELYKKLFPIIIWTDKQTYDHNSVVVINGHLKPQNTVAPVLITVTNPIGNIVRIDQIESGPNGDFALTLHTSSPLMKQNGNYVIKAQSGAETRSFKTQITLQGVASEVITCSQNQITVSVSNGETHCIPYGLSQGRVTGIDGTIDIPTKTLSLNIKSSGLDSITLNIPRGIIDSKDSTGADMPFVMMENDQIITYKELENNEQFRRIKFDVTQMGDSAIDIIGTRVVPEFGIVVGLILVVTMSTIIVFGKSFSRNYIKI